MSGDGVVFISHGKADGGCAEAGQTTLVSRRADGSPKKDTFAIQLED